MVVGTASESPRSDQTPTWGSRRLNPPRPARGTRVRLPLKGTAQIAVEISFKEQGQRTWARSSTYWPYSMTLSHSMGLMCSSSATSILSSWDPLNCQSAIIQPEEEAIVSERTTSPRKTPHDAFQEVPPPPQKRDGRDWTTTSRPMVACYFAEPVPKFELPEHAMPADAAYQICHDELNLDGNPCA